MKPYQTIPVFNIDPPPYPREGLFHLDMSEYCQVNRWLRHEAGRLARIRQLDMIASPEELRRFQRKLRRELRRKIGCVRRMIVKMPSARTGSVYRNTMEMRPFTENAITMEKISVIGARTAIRMIIWNAFCTLLTSVVRRVMMDDVLNLSIFANE